MTDNIHAARCDALRIRGGSGRRVIGKAVNAGLFALTLIAVLLAIWLIGVNTAHAADATEKYSPLFSVSLKNTLREFDEKEAGIFYGKDNSAVTELAEKRDTGTKSTETGGVEDFFFPGVPSIPSVPSVPSVTSSYSCGSTCGATCGSTCASTCTVTCGATCGATCVGTSSCAGSSTCVGSSSCAGASTCAGMSSCAGSSTCVGSNTCIGSSSCAGNSTCFGTSTCSGTSSCIGSSTCVGNSTCVGSSTCGISNTCSSFGATGCAGYKPPYPSSGGTSGLDPSPGGDDGQSGGGESQPGDGSSGNGGPSGTQGSGTKPYPSQSEPLAEGLADTPSDWALDEVMKCIKAGYVDDWLQNGYRDNITRADFCKVLANVLFDGFALSDFKDLLGASPFEDADTPEITCLYELGIVKGVREGEFNSGGAITRQEAAVMLYRAAIKFGARDRRLATDFEDQGLVADWAQDSLGFIVGKGIMKGVGQNAFEPLGFYTREQAYMTMIRLARIIPAKKSTDKLGRLITESK